MTTLTTGCQQRSSEEELGRVVFEVPEVPEAATPYQLPQLGGTPDDSTSHDGHGPGHLHPHGPNPGT